MAHQEQVDLTLHNAAKEGNEVKVAELLSQEDVADLIRKRDNHERTPLHLACFNNHANVVAQLLAAGASVNGTAKAGFSALHFAASAGAKDACEALLIGGAKPSVWEARKKHTPLHLAAMKGHADVVSVLLKYGADPVAKTKKGETPFDLSRKNEAVLAALRAFLDNQIISDTISSSSSTVPLLEKLEGEDQEKQQGGTSDNDNCSPCEPVVETGQASETLTSSNKRNLETDKSNMNPTAVLDETQSDQLPKKQKTGKNKKKKAMVLSLSHLENDDAF